MYDLIIKSGEIYCDGKFQSADIFIKDEKIVKLGSYKHEDTKEIINAAGLYISPGFIDVHNHGDLQILNGNNDAYNCLSQGITSVVVGNCGVSAAPTISDNSILLNLKGSYQFDSSEEYLQMIEKVNPPINVGFLAGHGSLRKKVMGYSSEFATSDNINNMKDLLEELMDFGFLGMSTGLIYAPGIYASKEELTDLCKTVKSYNGVYTTHMRNEGSQLIESITEQMEIAKKSGVYLEISHLKSAGLNNWGKINLALELINQSDNLGVQCGFDFYPYLGGHTTLKACIPKSLLNGELNKSLLDYLVNSKKSLEIINHSGLQNLTNYGWKDVIITNCSIPGYSGDTIHQLSIQNENDPAKQLIEILKEDINTKAIFNNLISNNDLLELVKHPKGIVGTDGYIFSKESKTICHPRNYGSFPRAISLAKSAGVCLEEIIPRLTKLPAERFNIKNRGEIKEGYFADLIIFSSSEFKDNAENYNPLLSSEGINSVIVNGSISYQDNAVKNKNKGQIIRRGK
jgi:N-acyl-D-amino-acid deacylase